MHVCIVIVAVYINNLLFFSLTFQVLLFFPIGHSNPAKKKKMTNIQPPTQHHPTITTATHFKPSQTKIKPSPLENPTHNQQKPEEKLIPNPNHLKTQLKSSKTKNQAIPTGKPNL